MSSKRDDTEPLQMVLESSEAQLRVHQQEEDDDDELTEAFHHAVNDPAEMQAHYEVGTASNTTAVAVAEDHKWDKDGFIGKAGVPVRSGQFTKMETETIKNAVKEYCAMKQISVTRLCSECDHKADLKGSWMEIAKCLPHRSVQSVYRHGLRQMHPFKRGAWTEEEVELLISSVTVYGKKWAQIQMKLNRTADACRDKYREMSTEYVRGRWKEEETTRLKELIREYLRVDPTIGMRELGKIVEAEQIKIPWSTISKRMEKRSRLSCFKKWQKMTGLFSASDLPRLGASSSNNNNNNNRIRGNNHQQQRKDPTIAIAEEIPDMDIYLLNELVSLDVVKASDVGWEDLRTENAQDRWYELLEEWQAAIMDDSMLALPVSEIAQRIIDQKASAQRAAETVEAVDLPVTF